MTTNAADRAVVAAIDLGTNSFHMVIADVDHLGFHIITTEKEVVRLGAGVQGFDHLSDDAIDRGIAALRRMKHIAQAHSAIVRAVATSAVREADNGPEFVERVRREVGIDVDVISGAEEARLIALGVRHSLALADQEVLMKWQVSIPQESRLIKYSITQGHNRDQQLITLEMRNISIVFWQEENLKNDTLSF